ncbi:MAG: putative membrane protein [Candidatus Daviesbacteria bacterium GW2011_GWA2_38_24]|uniref:Putative membrane protein n=1 Tax=Candidatus Daviesbacteria bacterium GW2011_GWA2_38_24 TaxID=1618422 RepID=A0A0G0MNE1_9BACT|nr:MAG: putative membrane protein [Candidatus Daviesbacteria bacterium GW2011_GWA2_38_24]KKQ79619.1 MAG: putative membrane protein [Candidatus Daviesbacteria bacterium GW2011_GWA1_38_7]
MVAQGLILVTIFILELTFLFLLSRSITSSVSSLVYRLTKNQHITINFLAILFLPGTIIHELSHMLMAGMLFVHVGEIEVFPRVAHEGVKLGSVEIGVTDPFRRALIGVAPLIFGTVLVVSSLWLFLPVEKTWAKVFLFYMIFEIGNTMFSSKKDQEGLVGLVLAITVIGVLVFAASYFFGIEIPYSLVAEKIFTEGFNAFAEKAIFYLSIPIIINLSLLGITKLLTRR